MRIIRTIDEMRQVRNANIGFVPTMGALHEGHLSLIRRARNECDTVAVSLFVNPTQFGPGEDFTRYPRNEERDAEMASSVGCDLLFAPATDEMYRDTKTVVSVKEISEEWEGAHRPGHFDGVATIVNKLFNIVQPAKAYFGLKDLQQCAVIRAMVKDLNMSVDLQFCPTVREHDGLAMSSRNAYLSKEEREKAPNIYEELKRCARTFSHPDTDVSGVTAALLESVAKLQDIGMRVGYFALVDTDDLKPKAKAEKGDSLIAAVLVGATRLIDNVQIE